MSTLHLTRDNFENEVLNYEGTVLVDFWASWCAPCRMLSPVIDQVAEEVSDAKIAKINVDEQQSLAARFDVMSIPTLIVFKNGKEVRRSTGVIPKGQILDMLK